jgi:hypothetical protein
VRRANIICTMKKMLIAVTCVGSNGLRPDRKPERQQGEAQDKTCRSQREAGYKYTRHDVYQGC